MRTIAQFARNNAQLWVASWMFIGLAFGFTLNAIVAYTLGSLVGHPLTVMQIWITLVTINTVRQFPYISGQFDHCVDRLRVPF